MALRFEINIGGIPMLLTPSQLDDVLSRLGGCDRFEDKYVGGNKGTGGTHYLKQVRRVCISDLAIKAHEEDQIAALEFATKLHDEQQSK